MKVTIIGTGNMGRGIGSRALAGGHEVSYIGTRLSKAQVGGEPLDVFIAGDDQEAKAKVAQLVSSGGMRPIDAGPLRRARELEATALLHMEIQGSRQTGFVSAIMVVP